MNDPHVLQLIPRCSLKPASAAAFVAVVGGTTFAVAGVFAAQGLWPVLPFAGLEVALLAWAVRASLRDGSKRETIAIDEDWITIRRSDSRGEHFSVFPRHGSRVTLRTPQTALHPSRLLLESRGRACEVGRFLTEDARRSLAARLKQLVGNV
ncbi:MAG TPA: DUF2244 domain-containing protein [Steroidobacteraceae bacterium]|jgi:uncharacterized membrane protein